MKTAKNNKNQLKKKKKNKWKILNKKKRWELWSIFIISSIWTTPPNSLGKNLENSLEEWEGNDWGMREKCYFEKKKRKKNVILSKMIHFFFKE